MLVIKEIKGADCWSRVAECVDAGKKREDNDMVMMFAIMHISPDRYRADAAWYAGMMFRKVWSDATFVVKDWYASCRDWCSTVISRTAIYVVLEKNIHLSASHDIISNTDIEWNFNHAWCVKVASIPRSSLLVVIQRVFSLVRPLCSRHVGDSKNRNMDARDMCRAQAGHAWNTTNLVLYGLSSPSSPNKLIHHLLLLVSPG